MEEFSFAEVSDPKLIKRCVHILLFIRLPPLTHLGSLGEKVNTAKVFRNFSEPYLLTNPTPDSVLAAVLTHGYPYVVPPLLFLSLHRRPSSLPNEMESLPHVGVRLPQGNGPDSWNRVIARKKPVVILFLDKDADDAKDIFAWYNKIGQARIENFAFLYAG